MQLILSFLISLAFLHASTTVLTDDFDTTKDKWTFENGFSITTFNTKSVLSGKGHTFARYNDVWKEFTLEATFYLDSGASAHFNMLTNGAFRYFIGVSKDSLVLSLQSDETTFENNIATISNLSLSEKSWITLKAEISADKLNIYLDGILKGSYIKSGLSTLSGGISIESLTDSSIYIDKLTVTTAETLTLSTTKWKSLGGPIGGLGYDIRFSPDNSDIMYVTDNHTGVAKSINRGKTWISSNSGITIKGGLTLDDINIFCLTVDENNPKTIWAGTNGGGQSFGAFKSTDSAATWINKSSGISLKNGEQSLTIRGFTVMPGDSNIVFMQADIGSGIQGKEFTKQSGRLFKTTDGGESWSEILSLQSLMRYLIIDPNNHNILYLSTGIFDREATNGACESSTTNLGGEGVYKSLDGGVTWSAINSGLKDLYVGALRMHPTNSSTLYAATGNNACSKYSFFSGFTDAGLYKTVNGGTSWEKVISKEIMTTVNFSPTNTDIIYAGSSEAFYKSIDGAKTWSKLTQKGGGAYGPKGIRAGVPIDVVVDPQNSETVFVNNYGGGVFRSTDGAKSWQVYSRGVSGAEIRKIDTNSKRPNALYAIGRSGPFLSQDYGNSFEGISNGTLQPEWFSIKSSPANPNIILMSDEHQGFLFRSEDNGENFTQVLKHPSVNALDANKRSGFKAIAFSPSNTDIVYIGLSIQKSRASSYNPAGTLLYKSTDGAKSFSAVVSTIDGNSINTIFIHPDDSDTILVGTTKGLFSSTDGAKTFTRTLSEQWINAIILLSDKKTLLLGAQGSGIYKSPDFGKTWGTVITKGFNSSNPFISSLIIDDKIATTLYAADLYSGVYRSTDSGESWESFPDFKMSGLANRAVADLAIQNGILYAGTEGGGILRYGTPPTEATQNFSTGWHLSVLPPNAQIDAVSGIENINSIWSYENSKWLTYPQINDYAQLESTKSYKGYWLNLTKSATLNYPTLENDFSLLKNGWQLLGTYNVEPNLTQFGTGSTLWIYENSSWKSNTVGGSTEFNELKAKQGFWLKR